MPCWSRSRGVAAGATVVVVSSFDGRGVEEVRERIKPGQTVAFVGSSGVGKSTLLNTLAGEDRAFVREIRADDARGRHTTTRRQLHLLPEGGLVLDTPGMREFALWDSEGLEQTFTDIDEIVTRCRFGNCSHNGEPGCAIAAALADGSLELGRMESWQKLDPRIGPPGATRRRPRPGGGAPQVEGDRQVGDEAHEREVRRRLAMTGEETAMIETQIHLPDAPAIPGLRFRTFDPNRDFEAYRGPPRRGQPGRRGRLHPDGRGPPRRVRASQRVRPTARHHPRRDRRATLVAAAWTDVRTRDGIGVHQVEGWVRPAWRRRGLGRALLHWTERRAAEVARVDGRPPQRAFSAWPDEDQVGATALYESEGYEIVRYGFMMVRDLADPIPDRALPAVSRSGPWSRPDHRRIWDADEEAFRDHWNRARADRGRFRAVGSRSPSIDTSLWRVAWDGDEVAGSVMTFVLPSENAGAWELAAAGSSTSASAGRGVGAGSRRR